MSLFGFNGLDKINVKIDWHSNWVRQKRTRKRFAKTGQSPKLYIMKTTKLFSTFFAILFAGWALAQDRTTVTATSNDISDNLDLRAVASIFGESKDLEDFERRLNDPKAQISNLDLNGDRQVDYLRVIESVEGNAHIIIVQAVLERDIFQDVATIEVERDNNNVVQVQVVGDVYMYGDNYVYQPVYVTRPIIYDHFWVVGYRPYWSMWYWGYYPTYYYGWAPYPIYRYRNHIHTHINVHNHYVYVNNPRPRHYTLAPRYRGNGYEVRNPGRSFRERNDNIRNNYELQAVRAPRSNGNVRSNTGGTRTNATVQNPRSGGTRNTSGNVRSTTTGTRTQAQPTNATMDSPRSATPRQTQATPRTDSPRVESAPRTQTRTETPRQATPRAESPRVEASPRAQTPRAETPRVQSPRAESPRASAPRQATPTRETSGGSRNEGRSGRR